MNDQIEKPMEGHEYDGIQEFDNPLPGWWLLTFFGTIIFSFIYYIHYEIAGGPTQAEELEKSMAVLKSLQKGDAIMDESKLLALIGDHSFEKGKEIYATRCGMCHGPQGEGLIGPNLTDLHFLHGGKLINIYEVIYHGVPDKGMVPWKDQLSINDIAAVTSYVYKLKGTFVTGGKPPQGKPE